MPSATDVASGGTIEVVRRRDVDDVEAEQLPSEDIQNAGPCQSEPLDEHKRRQLQRSVKPLRGVDYIVHCYLPNTENC
jgi:hypothetical protein